MNNNPICNNEDQIADLESLFEPFVNDIDPNDTPNIDDTLEMDAQALAEFTFPDEKNGPTATGTQAVESSMLTKLVKGLCISAMLVGCMIFTTSGNKMTSKYDMIQVKDAEAVFGLASSALMSEGLTDFYNMPKVYVLPKSNDPAPVPDSSKFTKIYDDERKNSDGSMIDYYKDETIEVKCWQETIPSLDDNPIPLSYHFAEVWIQHPSQFRRKLVDDTISSQHLAYPLKTFRKTNGVLGMTSDYCAFRGYGTIIHFGEAKRTTYNEIMDIMIFSEDGCLSSMTDAEFSTSPLYGDPSVLFTFAFGPVLVDNYEVCDDKVRNRFYDRKGELQHYMIGELNGHYPRGAIGQFGNELHYLLCTLDWTPKNKPNSTLGGRALDIATTMQKKGVRFAYNLDGGQTSTLMFNGQIINDVGYGGCREVSDVIYFATAIPNN